MGGQGDNRRLPDHGDRKATPPNHVAIRIAQFLVPDPGQIGKRLEAGDEKRPKEEQVEIVAREDFVDLRRLRAPWAIARRYRGFFSSGFPPHVEDFGSSHRLALIEPTAGGITSVAAALPRIGTAGGRSYGIPRF